MDITKLELPAVLTGVLIIASILCPGILFIRVFDLAVFLKADWIMVLLMGCSITFPVWFINTALVAWAVDRSPEDEGTYTYQHLIATAGGLIALPVVYIPVLIGFFTDIPLKTGVIIAIGIQICVLIYVVVDKKIAIRKAKRKEGSSPTANQAEV